MSRARVNAPALIDTGRSADMSESIRDLPRRIAARITITESGCWQWGGYLTEGYGRTWWIKREERAHRLVYEFLVGPIPAGLDFDHLCHNADTACSGGPTCPHRSCVNPDHCEPVTRKVNIRRGRGGNRGQVQRIKSHCPHGHPYDEVNTGHYLTPSGGPHRVCRTCAREAARRRRSTD